ncbi:uncharacterized protein M6B38_136960 [Iris pallida]|uniref:p-hydroxybenzoic acid efflux pump subunit aaeB n=1 Tax=Iris pallida TaxID=29817 RepID=A0AAX6FDG6_IRIPA|nr:uncharacterized protein M6B38_136960 [Iris pallida]
MPNSSTSTPPVRLSQHSRSLWRSRLGSALRTSLACAIVGIATLYSPMSIRRHLRFPAFAYMTAVLTVGDASSLGNTMKSAACAFYGIALGLLPAMLMFYLIRPEGVSAATTAVAVAISSFVVAASDLPGLITTRIALGQIVLVYVRAYKETGHVNPVVLHPVPVAASTALGAAAAVLALLFPYPRLAYCQVKEKSNRYTEMTKERLRVLVNAFCADSSISKSVSEYQAKSLAAACKKYLQNIKLLQGSVQWERPPFKFLPPPSNVPWERLEAIEIPLKGMEIALASITSASTKLVDQQVVKDDLVGLSNQISTKLKESNYFTSERGKTDKTFQSLHVNPEDLQCLPSLFFCFCIKLLDGGGMINPLPNSGHDHKITPETEHSTAKAFVEKAPSTKKTSLWALNISTERVVVASKCALSLGLAVFFGVLFSKDDGYWSGLTVAIAFTPCGEATFRLASVRAHGTALGSVYGVLGSFICQNLLEVRLLSLLPWVVFTSFLQRSRMYGPVGSLAATISAVIILGRINYGSPMIFAIDRLTETYIGLCCSIFVELLLQPARASTLARDELSSSLHMLREWLGSMANPVESKEKEKQLRKRVNMLKKCIGEAEAEPNFWFLPFPAASYSKLHASLAKTVDLILFLGQSMEYLVQVSHGSEVKETIKGDLDRFKKIIGTSVKFFEGVIQVKSLEISEKELQNKISSQDVEPGICPCDRGALIADEEECEEIVASLLQHAREATERLDENVGADVKDQLLLCLASIGFCIQGMMREIRGTGDGILELIQRENPCCNINLYDITCKLKVLPA